MERFVGPQILERLQRKKYNQAMQDLEDHFRLKSDSHLPKKLFYSLH